MAKVAGILGKKVGMTQLFDSKGDVRPATVLQAGPCVVTQHKTQTRDGYDAALMRYRVALANLQTMTGSF